MTYFKDENERSKTKYENYEILSTIFIIFVTFGMIAIILNSSRISVLGFGLIVKPVSIGVISGLTLSNKLPVELLMKKN